MFDLFCLFNFMYCYYYYYYYVDDVDVQSLETLRNDEFHDPFRCAHDVPKVDYLT